MEKLTPAGQGNFQQVTIGKPVVEALDQMAEDPMKSDEGKRKAAFRDP